MTTRCCRQQKAAGRGRGADDDGGGGGGDDGDGGGAETCSADADVCLSFDGADLNYSSSEDIYGFQFNVNGASVVGASGGAAAANGFPVSTSASVVLGFSFTGSSIPSGCGTLTQLSLNGNGTGLSAIVMSSPQGTALDFSYYEGGGDDCASGFYDCAGVCDGDAVEDCAGECGCSAELDE